VAEEKIGTGDVDAVVASGYADVMLAHDAPLAPYGVDRVAYVRTHNEWGWPVAGRGTPFEYRRDETSELVGALGWRRRNDRFGSLPWASLTSQVLGQLAGRATHRSATWAWP
jgi:hypothetical protein